MQIATQPDQGGATYGKHRAWHASLGLDYVKKLHRTVLQDMAFKGPLRVQRPFYPEGDRCHTYLLHPPGGMVSGDRIDINVNLYSGAHVFVTTPSAGKIYGADSDNVVQTQKIRLCVAGDANLEFLPQENILFDGANADLRTEIRLTEQSKLITWDVVSFGRPYGGFDFNTGSLRQGLELFIDDEPALIEGFKTDPALRILKSPVGLAGHIHMATMIVAAPSEVHEYEGWLEHIRHYLDSHSHASLKLSATHKNRLILIRALADDIELLRNTLIALWQHIRLRVMKIEPVMPRIWLT